MNTQLKIILILLLGIATIWLIYTKRVNVPFVTTNNDTYTLHEPEGQIKMGFEGPYKKDTSINWGKSVLDFNTTKLELSIPNTWTVNKIANNKNFISDNNEICKSFTSSAYSIKSDDNYVELIYNPTCNKPSDDLGMNSEDANITVSLEDTYPDGKNAQVSRFYNSKQNVYRYGISSGATSSGKIYNALIFGGGETPGTIFMTFKYTGPENKKLQYLKIVDWINAHPDIK